MPCLRMEDIPRNALLGKPILRKHQTQTKLLMNSKSL